MNIKLTLTDCKDQRSERNYYCLLSHITAHENWRKTTLFWLKLGRYMVPYGF